MFLSKQIGVSIEKILETLSENGKVEDYILQRIAEELGVKKSELFDDDQLKGLMEPKKIYSSTPKKVTNEILLSVQQWIDEMEQRQPGRKIWFQIEFQNRFPEFSDWIEKKRAGNDS